jgi:hypothetical protein
MSSGVPDFLKTPAFLTRKKKSAGIYIPQFLKILNAGYLPLALAGGNQQLTNTGA